MSEEAAFLEALKANPADDTARLVYADWLDEHGEPAKAEYLRLVTALAHAEQDYAREQPDVSRVLALAEELPQEWRAEAGSRFKLVFYSFHSLAWKVDAIKRIREISGHSLSDSKSLCERPPAPILVGVPFEEALKGSDYLGVSGHRSRVHSCGPNDGAAYAVVAELYLPDEPIDLEEPLQAFTVFLESTLSLSHDEARKLAETERVTIANGVTYAQARSQVNQLEQAIPAGRENVLWFLFVGFHPNTQSSH